MTTEIHGLGRVRRDSLYKWYISEPIFVPLFGEARRFVVEGYHEDMEREDFHRAIANFLSINLPVLKQAEQSVYNYYVDCSQHYAEDNEFPAITRPDQVWGLIRLAASPHFMRRATGDRAVYVSLECGCDWEPEHALQIVLRNGEVVTKVGPYDGHLSNADAYADDSLENVIYVA